MHPLPGKSGVSGLRLDRSWPPLALALMLWGLALVAYLLFTASLYVDPLLLLFPFIWVAHGLLLTWPLHEVMRRTDGAPPVGRWILVGVAVVVLAIVQALLDGAVSSFVVQHLMPPGLFAAIVVRTPDGDIDAGLRISLMIYFWVFGCFAVADGLLQSQRRLIEAQGAAQRAELTALRLQLHPHFLFNALNSVSALIVTGRHAEADTTTMNLAAFLRASLLSDQTAPVALADEIEALEAYLEVERVRFGDRLNVEMSIPEDLYDAPMPAFLLQPLIENAIKHAVGAATRAVRIDIVARRSPDGVSIAVSDDGGGGPPPSSGTGTGLRNIRERLAALYGSKASLTTSADSRGFTATVVFPIQS